MQHDNFQKIKQINLLTPDHGSKVSVRAQYILTCDMQHHHILKKLILY